MTSVTAHARPGAVVPGGVVAPLPIQPDWKLSNRRPPRRHETFAETGRRVESGGYKRYRATAGINRYFLLSGVLCLRIVRSLLVYRLKHRRHEALDSRIYRETPRI